MCCFLHCTFKEIRVLGVWLVVQSHTTSFIWFWNLLLVTYYCGRSRKVLTSFHYWKFLYVIFGSGKESLLSLLGMVMGAVWLGVLIKKWYNYAMLICLIIISIKYLYWFFLFKNLFLKLCAIKLFFWCKKSMSFSYFFFCKVQQVLTKAYSCVITTTTIQIQSSSMTHQNYCVLFLCSTPNPNLWLLYSNPVLLSFWEL